MEFVEYISLRSLGILLSIVLPFLILIASLWLSRKEKLYDWLSRFAERYGRQVVYIVGGLFLICLVYEKIIDYLSLRYLFTETGVFHQGLWNTINGNFCDVSGYSPHHLLLNHFEPILFFLLPLYYIHPTQLWLVFLPVIAAFIGGLVLYRLLEAYNTDKVLALLLTIAYFFYPTVYNSASWDYNSAALIMLFTLCALLMEVRKKNLWFFVFILLTMMCKEDVAPLIFCLGIYIFFSRKRRLLGAVTSAVSVVFLGAYLLITGMITNAPSFHIVDRFYPLASDSLELLLSPILHPRMFFSTLFSKVNISILARTLIPLALLPVFSGALSVGIYVLLIPTFLSQIAIQHNAFAQTHAYIVPFLFLGTALGVSFWVKRQRRWSRFLKKFNINLLVGLYIVGACVSYHLFYSWSPISLNASTSIVYAESIQEQFSQISKKFSEEDVIGTNNRPSSYLSNRRYISPGHDVDFDYVLYFLDNIDPTMNILLLESLSLDHFAVEEQYPNFIILKNAPKSTLNKDIYQSVYSRFDDAWGMAEPGKMVKDPLAKNGLATTIGGYLSKQYFQYLLWYPPGEYKLEIMLRGDPQPGKSLLIEIITFGGMAAGGMDFDPLKQSANIPLDDLSADEYRPFPITIVIPRGKRMLLHFTTPKGGEVYYDGLEVLEGLPAFEELADMFIDRCFLLDGEGELQTVTLNHELYSRPGFLLSEEGKTYSFTLNDVASDVVALNLSLMVSEYPYPRPLAEIVVRSGGQIIGELKLDRRRIAFDNYYELKTVYLDCAPTSTITLEITPLLADQLYLNMVQTRKLVEK